MNFACKWMEIENTILSELTQTQKDEYGMYSLISDIEPIIQILEKLNRKVNPKKNM